MNAMGDGTVPVYPVARLTIAMAPWFGNCKQCRRELGSHGPELIAKLVADDDTHFNFQCVDCLTAFVKEDAIRQMEDTPAANSTDDGNSGIVKP
jgi:hypothetical protein